MAEKIAELEKKLEIYEKRIGKLEKLLQPKKAELQETKSKNENDFKGLIGGIRFLISKGFLNSPKNVNQIQEDLKKEGYHYSYDSVDKILRVDLLQKQKILTRVKEENVWKYVIRK